MDHNIFERIGLKLGHYSDKDNLTGLSCFIAEQGAHIGIDIRGSNTATLNTPAYEPKAVGEIVHAIVLTGGSIFGLESAFGIMKYLEQKQIGNITRAGIIPGIAGAVIYDIAVGNGRVRPTIENGYAAAQQASNDAIAQGNVGVGTGATTGKWVGGAPIKGGFGIGITTIGEDILVAAFAVTNAVGDIINPKTRMFYSESGQQSLVNLEFNPALDRLNGLMPVAATNTTLAVIATNVSLNKIQLIKVAQQAHDGMARAIHPVHTNMDGDIVFALSSLSGERRTLSDVSSISAVDVIGLAASDALVKAINNSVIYAESIKGFPSYRNHYCTSLA